MALRETCSFSLLDKQNYDMSTLYIHKFDQQFGIAESILS